MLSNIATIISNVGIMIVISALFIILFYKQYRQMQHQQEQYIKSLQEQANKERVIHDEGTKRRDYATDHILDQLKELALKVKARRSYVFELHNGVNNMTGLPFCKVSMNYEYFEKGQKPVIHQYQSLPSSTVAPVIFNLYTSQWTFIYDNSEVTPELHSIAWFLKERNAKSVIFFPLKSSIGQIFGIVGFDFAEVQKEEDWDCEYISSVFKETIAYISGLLDYKRHG